MSINAVLMQDGYPVSGSGIAPPSHTAKAGREQLPTMSALQAMVEALNKAQICNSEAEINTAQSIEVIVDALNAYMQKMQQQLDMMQKITQAMSDPNRGKPKKGSAASVDKQSNYYILTHYTTDGTEAKAGEKNAYDTYFHQGTSAQIISNSVGMQQNEYSMVNTEVQNAEQGMQHNEQTGQTAVKNTAQAVQGINQLGSSIVTSIVNAMSSLLQGIG